MKNLKPILVSLGVLGSIVLVLYLFWYLPYQYERAKNYKLGYESYVTGTICEMVKPEHLINPKKCK